MRTGVPWLATIRSHARPERVSLSLDRALCAGVGWGGVLLAKGSYLGAAILTSAAVIVRWLHQIAIDRGEDHFFAAGGPPRQA
jgi:hypothetical protein